MDSIFEDGVAGRIEELKSLYAQLFVLLEDGLGDAPGEEETSERVQELAGPIGELMRAIDELSKALAEYLAAGGDGEADCSATLRGEMQEFRESLAAGLAAMHDRIEQRAQEVARARDAVKEALRALQEKKLSRRLYPKNPTNPVSTLLSSEA